MDNYIVRKISEVRKKKYYHKYYDKDDNELKDNKLINFLKKGIYIPPAYESLF